MTIESVAQVALLPHKLRPDASIDGLSDEFLNPDDSDSEVVFVSESDDSIVGSANFALRFDYAVRRNTRPASVAAETADNAGTMQ